MITPRAASLLCSTLLLSCALAPAEPSALAAAPQDSGDRSIRFGDAERYAYDVEFFPGATYDASLPTPNSFLGQQHGSRLARHDEVLTAFRAWAAASDRMTLSTFGHTHEGRELVLAVVTSPANHARLESIRGDIAKLADPRGLPPQPAHALRLRLPEFVRAELSVEEGRHANEQQDHVDPGR